MYHNQLSKNIAKRYLYILHRCLTALDIRDKEIIQEKGAIELSDLIKDSNFNIFICFIEELINQKKLKSKQAKLILLFCNEFNFKHKNTEPFLPFYNQNENQLISQTKFLEFFLPDAMSSKLKLDGDSYSKVLYKLNTALNLADKNLPDCLKQTINKKTRYVNINNEYGLINSLTIYKCYDLIFLSLNNPYFLIIEQIIHEQTHIKFGKLIETIRYERLFEVPYSAYSPFAEKVRPIEYIANGYFSFLSVLNLYHFYLEKYQLIKGEFEIDSKRIIKNRIKTLTPRIKIAEKVLNNIFKGNLLWKKFISEFKLNYQLPIGVVRINKFKYTDMLSDIQNAEIILGLNTNKISRITIPISQTKKISEILPIDKYLFSNDAFVDSDFEELKYFKNIHTNVGSHLNSSDDDNTYVNCYIGKKVSHVKRAVEMDQIDKSGDLFNIPKCCQKHFLSNWSTIVKKYKGDFTKYTLLKIDNNQKFKWQTNSIAMYFDAGFTWHFPCTFNCKNTILLSTKRYRDLKKVNKKLADKLVDNATGEFHLLSNNNYLRIKKSENTFTKENDFCEIVKKITFA